MLIKDSAIYVVGELVSKAFPFLLLPYLSRKLSVEGFGELSYYQTLLSLFVVFIGLSQEGAVTRYFYVYGKRSLNLVVNIGYIYTILVGTISLLFGWLMKSEIMAYVVLSAISQVFFTVQLSIRQCQKQAIPYVFIQLSLTITNVLFTILLLEIFNSDLVEKRIIAILLSNLLVSMLSYVIYRRKIVSKKISLRLYKIIFFYVIGFGLPMILHNGSLFIKGQLDRIFIFHRFSEVELGLYAMGAQIASILSVFILAINKALVPYLFEKLKQGSVKLKDLHIWSLLSLLIVPIPSLVTLIVPEQWLLFFLGKHFIGVKYYVIVFLLATSLTIPYLFLVNYLFYHGKTKEISFCSVLSTMIYLGALGGLIFTDVVYIPYASVLGALGILPILYMITSRVK